LPPGLAVELTFIGIGKRRGEEGNGGVPYSYCKSVRWMLISLCEAIEPVGGNATEPVTHRPIRQTYDYLPIY